MVAPREAIVRAYDAALAAADPALATRRQVVARDDATLKVAGLPVPSETPIQALAIGKAAARMTLGLIDALGDRLERGFVLTKDGQTSDRLPLRVTQEVAAHPVLDERSLAATARLLEWLGQSPVRGLTVCLISGGGSALLELPVNGVSLEAFQETTKLFLNAGADIHQLNAVRSQISQVKGGGLRRHIPSRHVVNLLLSDVLGNDVSVIASGPTVQPVTTRADALAVLESLALLDRVPESVRRVLEAQGDSGWSGAADDQTVIVADNQRAIVTAAKSLGDDGYQVRRSALSGTGEAAARAGEWIEWLATLPSAVTAAVGGGEYTVNVRGDGHGGRNTEFALTAALAMERAGIGDWTVASLATDGDDATTGAAGGLVDGSSAGRMRERGHDPEADLARNDSLAPLATIGATHVTGPTGTNVNDLYLAVRG